MQHCSTLSPIAATVAAGDAVLARLATAGLVVRGEPGARKDVERPIGHHTHNLLVKDKKSGDVFLVTHRQAAKANLADVAKKVGAKNLRLASADTVRSASSFYGSLSRSSLVV